MILIRCAACKQTLGWVCTVEEADPLAYEHDPECPATEDEKIQAAVDIRFRYITRNLAKEWFE